jgi:hypothetical protein
MGSVTLHTDIPTRSEIQRLLLTRDPCCVSAYLPTSPITQAAQADRIELKNLVSDASGRLEAAGAGRAAVCEVRESLDALVEEDSGAVTFATDDAASYGVVDEIARRVPLTGGRVLAVRGPEIPGGRPLAAILRYAP